MSKVTFYYDFKKDAWSWVLIAKDKDCWGLDWRSQVAFIPDDLLKKIIKKGKKPAESLVYNYLISHPKRQMRQLVIKEELQALKESWRKIESRFFKKLEQITQKPVFMKTLKCYFTSGFMCPYNDKEKWFMVSMWHSIPMSITTICHEILHLQFLYYYKNYCRKFLSEKQTEDLKEAMTFILNTDFSNLVLVNDRGYPSHQKSRKELEKIWGKRKNFQDFLDKAIKIMKKKKL